MSIEKEKYLRVATPEEWDYWLTLKADANVCYDVKDWHVKEIEKLREKIGTDCLFCKVFEVTDFYLPKWCGNNKISDCRCCMKCKDEYNAPCLSIDPKDRVDLAIERLEKVGLWD
jgi:hypothetical protein